MIIHIEGSDQESKLNYLRGIKANYTSSNKQVYEYEGLKENYIKVIDSTKSYSLLTSNPKLIIIYLTKSDYIDINKKQFRELEQVEDTVIFDLSNINKSTNFYKEISKFGQKKKFVSKNDFTTFGIADDILYKQSINSAMKKINKQTINDQFVFQVLFAFHYNLTQILSYIEQNNISKKQKLFIKNKIAKSNHKKNKIKKVYEHLTCLDIDLKSSAESKETLLHDFLIKTHQTLTKG